MSEELKEVIEYLSLYGKYCRERATTFLLDENVNDANRYIHLAQASEMIKRNLSVDHPKVLIEHLQRALDAEKEK